MVLSSQDTTHKPTKSTLRLSSGRTIIEGTIQPPIFTKTIDPKHYYRSGGGYAVGTESLIRLADRCGYLVHLKRRGSTDLWANTRDFVEHGQRVFHDPPGTHQYVLPRKYWHPSRAAAERARFSLRPEQLSFWESEI